MLPTVTLHDIRVFNPEYVAYTDMEMYLYITVTAEVLTLHFEKQTMRVRYKDLRGKIQTRDVPAAPFFNDYSVKLKPIL